MAEPSERRVWTKEGTSVLGIWSIVHVRRSHFPCFALLTIVNILLFCSTFVYTVVGLQGHHLHHGSGGKVCFR